MRKLFFFLILLKSLVSQSATYYVSNSGNDSNSGLSTSLAWQTLTKVNSATFSAGDQILFKRGDIFYGSMTISQPGTSGNPIIFGAYGSGANPIITGFTDVTSWTNLGSNIWESTNAVSTLSTLNMVTINGLSTPMGRYPNENAPNQGYIFNTSATNTSLTATELNGMPDLTGAEVVIRGTYTLNRRTIATHVGGTITWSSTVGNATGQPFFIQNSPNLLDQQNEWYYNPTTKKLMIYSTTQPVNVKISTIENLITLASVVGSNFALTSYLNFSNITFTGANSYAFYAFDHIEINHRIFGLNISNCNVSFTGIANVYLVSINGFTLNGNTFSDSNGDGVVVQGSTNLIFSNNVITNIGINKGMAQGWGAISALGISNCTTALVEYNRIINVGYDGINYSDVNGTNYTIQYNFIDTFCKILDDGGGIYGNRNATIKNNIVLNGGGGRSKLWNYDVWAVGIYLDDNSFNNEVAYNTVYNCDRVGIYLHNSKDNNVHHNLCYHNRFWQLYTSDNQNAIYPFQNNTITDNIFVGLPEDYVVAKYQYGTSGEQVGTINRNIYARPINSGYSTLVECEGSFYTTFSNWQSFSGQDANSKISPVSVSSESDIQFMYNETNATKIVVLTNPSVDMNGVKCVGSITLQPYTSAIYLKDSNPATQAPANRRHPVKSVTKYYGGNGYYYTL